MEETINYSQHWLFWISNNCVKNSTFEVIISWYLVETVCVEYLHIIFICIQYTEEQNVISVLQFIASAWIAVKFEHTWTHPMKQWQIQVGEQKVPPP